VNSKSLLALFDLAVNIRQRHNCIITSFPQHSIVWELPKEYYTTNYILSPVGIGSPENWFPPLLVRVLNRNVITFLLIINEMAAAALNVMSAYLMLSSSFLPLHLFVSSKAIYLVMLSFK